MAKATQTKTVKKTTKKVKIGGKSSGSRTCPTCGRKM